MAAALLNPLGACCLTTEAEGSGSPSSSSSGGTSSSTSSSGSTSRGGTTGGRSTTVSTSVSSSGSSSGGCPAIDAGLPHFDPDAGWEWVAVPAFAGACGGGLGIVGCGRAPEFTQWQQLAYDVALPAGGDGELQVRVADTLDAGVLGTLEPVTVCGSLLDSCCENPINLAPFNIPGAQYFVVTVEPLTGGCVLDGGPWLVEATVNFFCADD